MSSIFLQIPFRHTTSVSLSGAIKQYISTKYDQSPEMFVDDLRVIDELRTNAINVQEPHFSGIKRVQAYAAQLRWIGGKFPIDIGVDFSWYPALGYNTAQPVTQNNLRFELANILFNLAALYSQLAFATNRTTSDGLKNAATYLCAAAGTFAFLRTEILPDMRSTPPEDMDEWTLQSLEKLCLAQAQEGFWSKAVKDGLKDATIARLAAKVSDYYAEAGDFAVKSDATSTDWLHHMSAKQHHFAAAAQYRQSRECLEKRRYGEEVARLRDSINCVNEALKEQRWINRAVLGDLNGLKNRVTEDLKRAEKDNDMIYLMPVPSKPDLKLLGRADMVSAKPPKEVADGVSMLGEGQLFGPPLFSKLVPYSVHIAASIYSDRRDRLINNTIIAELEAMTARLHDLLQSLNLPGSLQAIEKPLGLPPSLVSKAEELRQQDGLYRLKRSMDDIAKLKSSDMNIFGEGKSLLQAEKEEDNRARTKYGTERWNRPTSEIAGQKFYSQTTEIEGYLKSAASSDTLVENKLRDFEELIRIMTGTNRDLESYVPSSRRVNLTPEVDREAARLRNCLHEVSRLETRRKRKDEALKEKAKMDDINPLLRQETGRLEREFPMQKIEASQFESLFEEHLQIYNADRDALSTEQSDQDDLAGRLQECNTAFLNARKGDTSETKAREKALQNLENGYLKYKEIVSNLDVGRKFYNDLATIVTRFRDGCKSFVHSRRVEASHLESEITTASLSNLNLSSTPTPSSSHLHHHNQAQGDRLFQQIPRPTHGPSDQPHQEQPLPAPRPSAPATIGQGPAAMWQPEMGIKFAPVPSTTGGPAQGLGNPHAPAYPEARRTVPGDEGQRGGTTGTSGGNLGTGTWTQGKGIRFS